MATVSVIMPVRDAGLYLERTLPAVLESGGAVEFIIVDDASTDGSVAIARRHGLPVVELRNRCGPAVARNAGARQAKGDILVFVDSDVLVHKTSIADLTEACSNGRADAVFGSYDDAPPARNFASQYANLRHHYYHQQASGRAETFWAGFGAVTRDAFEGVGGFDPDVFGVEDIALGYRLNDLGYRIHIDPSIQVTHLKRWTLPQLIRTDIFLRAAPWSRLLLTSSRPATLNVSHREKWRAALACLLPVAATAGAASAVHGAIPAVVGLLVAAVNTPITRFFAARRGWRFAIAATAMHQVYYVYSTATFVTCRLALLARSFARVAGLIWVRRQTES